VSAAAVLRIGTRGSALALAQSGRVGAAVAALTGCRVELIRIRTEGDVNRGPLATIGGTGVFVTAVRAALVAGDVDMVVHSFKDLPTAPADGLRLAAVPAREDPADALCARDHLDLEHLPRGARVGTGAPRRAAQLLRLRPDLEVVPLRGNVDTRLGLVRDGTVDAVVLAAAGLARLDRGDAITEMLGPPLMLPAPAQGALAVECRNGESSWYTEALGRLDDPESRAAGLAERGLLAGLEAGCTAPVAAWARSTPHGLRLDGRVVAPDGTDLVEGTITGVVTDDADADARADALGRTLAAELLDRGVAGILSP
jgi:hydroxymethylbilane synthase